MELIQESPWRWRIDPAGDMRVPGVVFASHELLPDVMSDRSIEQVANVATLPGIVEASFAMPDVHWGYGFPIGGVAATAVDEGGVVSPGGVGFDISCGVRLLISERTRDEIRAPSALMSAIARHVPKGMGPGAVWELNDQDLDRVLASGARYAVSQGYGTERDLLRCEDGGALEVGDASVVSDRARRRGARQLGSIGSGNHFVEVQHVAEVLDERVAARYGLYPGRVCVMIHTGSRGLGHQVCTDQLGIIETAMRRHGITVPDRQLACVPVRSPEGEAYMASMAAAANYGRANRQLLTHAVREAFFDVGEGELELLYDVSHNLAKIERHAVDGRTMTLCVHRKGATRALPAGHPDVPEDLLDVGQPVLVPGSMGTASYVLVGDGDGAGGGRGAFQSTCHGAGRRMSRTKARKSIDVGVLREQLRAQGIEVRAGSSRGLVEEAPESYKDVDAVVDTVVRAGLATAVARLVPIGVVKG